MDSDNKIEEELGNDAATAQTQESDNQNDNNKQVNEDKIEHTKEKKEKQPKPEKPAKVKKVKKVKKTDDLDNDIVRKKLRQKRSQPVSFISLFVNQILFFIPILGFIPIIVSIIKPSCNKNIKTLAWTAIVWQFIMMGGLVLFTYTKGVGYILGWLENELNVRLF